MCVHVPRSRKERGSGPVERPPGNKNANQVSRAPINLGYSRSFRANRASTYTRVTNHSLSLLSPLPFVSSDNYIIYRPQITTTEAVLPLGRKPSVRDIVSSSFYRSSLFLLPFIARIGELRTIYTIYSESGFFLLSSPLLFFPPALLKCKESRTG